MNNVDPTEILEVDIHIVTHSPILYESYRRFGVFWVMDIS